MKTISSLKNPVLLLGISLSTVFLLATTVLVGPRLAGAQDCSGPGYVIGNDGFGGVSCTDPGGGQNSPADVVLTANPSTIQQGNASLLSWGPNGSGSYPYDTCTLDHGIGVVATVGSVSVSPAVTTTYGISCTHTYQVSTPCGNTNCFTTVSQGTSASATVTVTPNPTLLVSCSVNPSPLPTNGTATWSVIASGGTDSYTYAWSGTDGLSGTGTSVSKMYATPGTKVGTVAVTQVGGQGLNTTLPEPGHEGLLALVTKTLRILTQPIQTAHAMFTCDGSFPLSPTGDCGGGGVGDGGTTFVTCTNTLPVVNATSPDLTAGPINAVSGTATQPVTLSSTISNIGNGPTGAPFTDTFFIDSDQNTSNGYIAAPTFTSGVPGGFPANYSEPNAQVSNTFATAGTYYYRVCADNNPSYVGTITESNEGNNCSNWGTITIAAAVLPPLSCSVSPSSGIVTIPGSATYTASGASAPYTWTAPDGGSYGTGAQATRLFNSVGGPYAMTVKKAGYSDGQCLPNVTASVAPACPGPGAAITASSTRVQVGQSTTISYSAAGVNTSCTITGPGAPSGSIGATSCSIPGNGGSFSTGALTTQATYTITCDGTAYPSVIVNVIPKFQEF